MGGLPQWDCSLLMSRHNMGNSLTGAGSLRPTDLAGQVEKVYHWEGGHNFLSLQEKLCINKELQVLLIDSCRSSLMTLNILYQSEPVFVNVYGAQESIPRNRFRQPLQPDGPVRKIGLSYRPARLEIDSWSPSKVCKYGLWENVMLFGWRLV